MLLVAISLPNAEKSSNSYSVTNYGGEIMPAEAGCIPTRPASGDQVHTKNNKHTPVMV